MAFDSRVGGFFLLTGVTVAGFASGFGDCLFDMDKIDSCIAVADHWEGVFLETGQHIVQWFIALAHKVLER